MPGTSVADGVRMRSLRLVPALLTVGILLLGCSTAEKLVDRVADTGSGSGDRVLYLTFDDGPGGDTEKYLDVLRANNAKATFFLVGRNLESRHELAKKTLAEGHVLANHSWNHTILTNDGDEELSRELDDTAKELQAVGATGKCMRPPTGAIDPRVKKALDQRGMTSKLWHVDIGDWRNPGVDAIVDTLLSSAKPGAVILMHDGGGDRAQGAEALAKALPQLVAQGYTFAPLPGC
ncbi:polysaccharide deacetylase family protein [Pseudonocardiaceae bacterium YIM PH 21723]|nr:polysaccharide deacetylase family protein [Pseudonocardiaceae bacterium YIM PH 21723]